MDPVCSVAAMPSDDELSIPRSGWAERLRTLALGGLGAVPGVGSPISAVVGMFWRSAFEKRVEEYFTIVIDKLDAHDTRITNLESLFSRDLAISAGIAGVRAAGKAYSREKLENLANAVVRVTVDPTWDTRADYAMLLLQLADDLSVTHVRVLSWLGSARWPEQLKTLQGNSRTLDDIIAEEFTGEDGSAIQGIIADLISRNLVINRSSFLGPSTMFPDKLGDLGHDFLQFVSPDPALPATDGHPAT